MGFRTTMTTEDLGGIRLPKWFVEKWKDDFNFGEHEYQKPPYDKGTMLISTKNERKFYFGKDQEILKDIQKVCKENDIEKFVVVLLHECGGITRVEIGKEIRFSEPTGWDEVEDITHDSCYGCSDIKNLSKKGKE
jgi:hypothetical protein